MRNSVMADKILGGVLIYYNAAGEQMWSINLAINKPAIKTTR